MGGKGEDGGWGAGMMGRSFYDGAELFLLTVECAEESGERWSLGCGHFCEKSLGDRIRTDSFADTHCHPLGLCIHVANLRSEMGLW